MDEDLPLSRWRRKRPYQQSPCRLCSAVKEKLGLAEDDHTTVTLTKIHVRDKVGNVLTLLTIKPKVKPGFEDIPI